MTSSSATTSVARAYTASKKLDKKNGLINDQDKDRDGEMDLDTAASPPLSRPPRAATSAGPTKPLPPLRLGALSSSQSRQDAARCLHRPRQVCLKPALQTSLRRNCFRGHEPPAPARPRHCCLPALSRAPVCWSAPLPQTVVLARFGSLLYLLRVGRVR